MTEKQGCAQDMLKLSFHSYYSCVQEKIHVGTEVKFPCCVVGIHAASSERGQESGSLNLSLHSLDTTQTSDLQRGHGRKTRNETLHAATAHGYHQHLSPWDGSGDGGSKHSQ